ncbi:MAG: hypothetical protein IGS03_06975 [Candidatus Sericytochromatia bacterium]|nr:hypothetical protein [Candidatus Sericytochromatia bacterium]
MDLNALSRHALKTAQIERSGQAPLQQSAPPEASSRLQQNPGLRRSSAAGPLRQPAAAEMQQKIEQAQPAQMQAIAQKMPVPDALAAAIEIIVGPSQQAHPLASRPDAELVGMLMRGEGASGPRYHQVLRNAEELEASGILARISHKQISR